jgi:hypothetical protein
MAKEFTANDIKATENKPESESGERLGERYVGTSLTLLINVITGAIINILVYMLKSRVLNNQQGLF